MSETYLRVEQNGDVCVAGFPENAELDANVVEQVGRELYALVESGGHRSIVLDLENLKFLSSLGIGVLLTFRLKAARTGAEIVLARVRPEFNDLFELTNFEKLFRIFATLDEALQHFDVAA